MTASAITLTSTLPLTPDMYTYCVRFSGITLRFRFPDDRVELPEELRAFACADEGTADAEYDICLLREPLRPAGAPFFVEGDAHIYRTDEGWLRIHTALTAKDSCQVACLLRPDGKNTLYYPASRWDFYAKPLHCLRLLAIEAVLLRQNAFLLHSSVVHYGGKAVLFSGPSGMGKSTQARLWQKHLGAKVVNGDRALIQWRGGGFCAGGSPWAGTSGIYCPDSAPIAAIVLLQQAEENRMERLGRQSFIPLFTQTVTNSWDEDFMQRITDLFARLLEQVPVYRLSCRPDEDSVRLAHRTIFGKEAP